jgi:tRNA 2-thiouridine synthesizing protein A
MPLGPDIPDAAPVAEALLRDLDRLTGRPCHDCSHSLCGHEVVGSIVLGFKNAPRCLSCLSHGLRRVPSDLRDQIVDYVQRRDCYRQAWDAASDREGQPRDGLPRCLSSPVFPGSEGAGAKQGSTEYAVLSTDASLSDPLPPTPPSAEWDAGAMACGELVMHLRGRLLALPTGAVLRLTATDPAAPEDLPAWCRLTGHTLLQADHPVYLIRRKET